MKTSLKKAVLVSGLLLSSAAIFSQQLAAINDQDAPAPVMGMNTPPPPHHPKHHPQGPNEGSGLMALTTLSGKLIEYTANDRSVYDGFKLQNGNQTVTVSFPSHLGEQLMKSAKRGASIIVNGYYESRPGVLSEFRLVTAQCGNTTVNAAAKPVPTLPPAEEAKDFTGTVNDFRRDPDGFVNGIILSTKEVVELSPSAVRQLQGSIKVGDKISGSGIKVVPPAGVVMVENTQLIRAQILTIAGQSYIVR